MELYGSIPDSRHKFNTSGTITARIPASKDLPRHFQEAIDRDRDKYFNAGQAWTRDDEKCLKVMYENGKSMHNMVKRLGRTQCALESRLIKMGLMENKHAYPWAYR